MRIHEQTHWFHKSISIYLEVTTLWIYLYVSNCNFLGWEGQACAGKAYIVLFSARLVENYNYNFERSFEIGVEALSIQTEIIFDWTWKNLTLKSKSYESLSILESFSIE